jgi:hypothetical protein
MADHDEIYISVGLHAFVLRACAPICEIYWPLNITGTNGFCGRCAGKLKIKALPLRLDAAPLAVSKM